MRYDLHDALGSVIAQVSLDEDEPQVVWAAQYDAYGKKLAKTSETSSPYQWGGASGYYFDKDVGMILMGLRWYDVETGRFLTRDPIGFSAGDSNFFRPMGNNPANAVDPWGLDVFLVYATKYPWHAWVVIGGKDPVPLPNSAGFGHSFGAYPSKTAWEAWGSPAEIHHPDEYEQSGVDFTYEQWKTTPEMERKLEQWILQKYNVMILADPKKPSFSNPNVQNPWYGATTWNCQSFVKSVRDKLIELFEEKGIVGEDNIPFRRGGTKMPNQTRGIK
jgi:RHS repeat-associated protein